MAQMHESVAAEQGGEVGIKDMLFHDVRRLTVTGMGGVVAGSNQAIASVYLSADEARRVATALLPQQPPSEREPFPPVESLTLWELAQAIAVNSDIATNRWVKPTETDEEEEANRAEAYRYYDRRNDCIGEIKRRELAGDYSIASGGESGKT